MNMQFGIPTGAESDKIRGMVPEPSLDTARLGFSPFLKNLYWIGKSPSVSNALMKTRKQITSCLSQKEDNPVKRKGGPYDELSRYGIDETDFDFRGKSSDAESSMLKSVEPHKGYVAPVPKADLEFDEWCVYLLLSGDFKKTYVGMTCNLIRRIKQHNGELPGGSKAAHTGRPWSIICAVHGFKTRSEASKFEYQWKSETKSTSPALVDENSSDGSHLLRRRQNALEKVMDGTKEWKTLRVEWHTQEN